MTSPRTASALFLTCLLAACGGQYDADPGVHTASSLATASTVAAPAGAPAAPPAAAAVRVDSVASATMPAPDCAAEGCASLRIIDGNAEAWRIDAGRREAREAAASRS